MDKKIRWGILSTARIGANHVIPAIQQSTNGVVTAVGSRDLARGQAFAAKLGIAKAYGSYEALLADPDIDAIYNPLPNDQHGPWSIRAAEAGKPVLCEKPIAVSAEEAQQIADAFAAHKLPVAEAFMYRFHPQTQYVKDMVDAGAVGDIHFMGAAFSFSIGNEDDIRLNKAQAGGALMDIGCYCVNVIRYMTGEEPTEVRAFADIGVKSQVDERLAGLLCFPSGVLAHMDCSFRTHSVNTYEIRGTQGRILVEKGFQPAQPDAHATTSIRYWRSLPRVNKEEYQEIKIAPANHYTLMVEDFADAVLHNRPPRFSIEDSIKTMRVIDQLYASAREQNPTVKGS